MSIRELVLKNRSCRRFHQDERIDLRTLEELVDLARCSASAKNFQPLRYVLSADPATNALIFPKIGWAGYLTDWPGPEEGERPSAYLLMMVDKNTEKFVDLDTGIAAQSILLGATEKGLGGCMLSSVNRDALMKELGLPEDMRIVLAIALGRPKETVVIEDLPPDGDIRYYRDKDWVHHVPKRPLQGIILRRYQDAERK